METIYTIDDSILPHYCESSISVSSDKKYISIGSTKGEIYIINRATGQVYNNF
jgi:hypothetical protein